MKILIVSPVSVYPNTRGTTVRIVQLYKKLKSRNCEVYILHAGKTCNEHIIGYLSLESLISPHLRLLRFLDSNFTPFNPFFIMKLITSIKKINPDFVQFEFPYSYPLIHNIIRNKMHFHSVMDLHNVQSDLIRGRKQLFFYPFTYWLENMALKNMDLIFTVSKDDKNRVLYKYGLNNNRIFVINNGVNFNRFIKINKEQVKKDFQMAKGKILVLFHGSMSSTPNIEASYNIINNIAPNVIDNCQDIIFLIAGEGSKQLHLSSLSLKNHIKFLGYVDDISELIMISDICIVPLISGGGTSLKILEYLAAKKNIITTTIGIRGLEEIQNDNITITDDISDFQNKILELSKNILRVESEYDIPYHIIKKYDWGYISDKIKNIYEDYINDN